MTDAADTTNKYSLWLLPQGPEAARLDALIAQLAQHHHAPAFSAHLTLLGGIRGEEAALRAQTARFAARLDALQLRLGAAATGDDHYHCVFLPVLPDAALRRMRALAQALFPSPQRSPFEPHLSLLYGDHSAAEKRRIVAQLPALPDQVLPIGQLALWQTGGTPAQWYCVQCCALGTGGQ